MSDASQVRLSSVRTVEVPLRRLGPWLAGFGQRHPDVRVRAISAGPGADGVGAERVGAEGALGDGTSGPAAGVTGWELTAADGQRALVEIPRWLAGAVALDSDEVALVGSHAAQTTTFAVLVIRRAGYAAAVFHGQQRLWGKAGRRHVHGRTAAGGWSQQRYARRRANQADEIVGAVAAAFADGMRPRPAALHALATGGDRALLGQTRAQLARTDRRLGERLAQLPEVSLAFGTPTARDLAGVPDRVLAARIHLTDTTETGGSDD